MVLFNAKAEDDIERVVKTFETHKIVWKGFR